MKKLIIVLLLAIAFTSCTKEVNLPHTDLSNYIRVDIQVWHEKGAPMKEDYYLDMGSDAVPVHPWATVITKWSGAFPFYPCKYIYVLSSDYTTYL